MIERVLLRDDMPEHLRRAGVVAQPIAAGRGIDRDLSFTRMPVDSSIPTCRWVAMS